MTLKKIGILGGTFDPIHNGHLILAEEARSAFGLEMVLLIPTGHSYFKDDRPQKVSDPKDRLAMTRLAVLGEPGFLVSDLEIRREGNTYTADTLQELHALYPEASLYYIVGADTLCHMGEWYKPEEVFSLCEVLVAVREDTREDELVLATKDLESRYEARIHRLPSRHIDISSTEIRSRIGEGKSIRFQVPSAVEDYILSHELYFSNKSIALTKTISVNHANGSVNYAKPFLPSAARTELIRKMEETLPYERFLHTLGVAETAASLALCHGADAARCELAGILHDCAKTLPSAEKIRLCESEGLVVTDLERENDELLHSKAGMVLAKTKYGVQDEEILSAIACHSTGKPGMTLLEQIVFVADYMEPGRTKARRLPEIRRAAFRDLREAMLMILEDTLAYLQEKKAVIDPRTEETYRYYRDAKPQGAIVLI